jgi:hypothetical protein
MCSSFNFAPSLVSSHPCPDVYAIASDAARKSDSVAKLFDSCQRLPEQPLFRAAAICQDIEAKSRERIISFPIFSRKRAQSLKVPLNNAKIAAAQGTGPRGASADALEILEGLPRERQKGSNGTLPGKARFRENAHCRFDHSENVPSRQGRGDMICGFATRWEHHRDTAQFAADAARHAQGYGSSFDCTCATGERGDGAAAEGLQRMQGTDFRTSKRQRLQNITAQRAARVQYDLSAPSLTACDLGESFRCWRNRAIWGGD